MSSPIATPPAANPVSHWIAGRHQSSTSARWGDVFNPSTGRVQASVPLDTAAEADLAVRAAATAWPDWRETPAVERARVMFRFRHLLHEYSEELAALVTREHGKTLAESRAEMQRGIEMVEFSCGIPSLLAGQSVENLATHVDCETTRHPLGVCVGITPFNFPSMVPLWMFPVAITCGNTFVLKPSEKVPLSAMRLGELLHDAGLPPGVMNIVHGDRTAVDALCSHPAVRAVSFVGSTNVARHIYETGTAHGKRVQSAGGAKNHMIIMPDADLDQAVAALVASAFGCAGERCMAGSVAVPVGRVADGVVEGLVRAGEQLKVGPTDGGEEVDMGPLITRAIATASRRIWTSPAAKARTSCSTAARATGPATAFCWGRASSTACSPTCDWPARKFLGQCCRWSAPAIWTKRWPSGGNASTATGPVCLPAAAGPPGNSSATSTRA